MVDKSTGETDFVAKALTVQSFSSNKISYMWGRAASRNVIGHNCNDSGCQ